jgi:hypothetical protein
MVVHAKMPVYTISINQRSKLGIDHQNNQPTFLIEKIIFNFFFRSPISKKGHKCRVSKCVIHLVSE